MLTPIEGLSQLGQYLSSNIIVKASDFLLLLWDSITFILQPSWLRQNILYWKARHTKQARL